MLLVGDSHGRVSVYHMRNVPEPQEDPVSVNSNPQSHWPVHLTCESTGGICDLMHKAHPGPMKEARSCVPIRNLLLGMLLICTSSSDVIEHLNSAH